MTNPSLELFQFYRNELIRFAHGEILIAPHLPEKHSDQEKEIFDRAALAASETLVFGNNVERRANYSGWVGQIDSSTGLVKADKSRLGGNYPQNGNLPALDTNGDGRIGSGWGGDKLTINASDEAGYVDALASMHKVSLTTDYLLTGQRPPAHDAAVEPDDLQAAQRQYKGQWIKNHDYTKNGTATIGRLHHGYGALPAIVPERLQELVQLNQMAQRHAIQRQTDYGAAVSASIKHPLARAKYEFMGDPANYDDVSKRINAILTNEVKGMSPPEALRYLSKKDATHADKKDPDHSTYYYALAVTVRAKQLHDHPELPPFKTTAEITAYAQNAVASIAATVKNEQAHPAAAPVAVSQTPTVDKSANRALNDAWNEMVVSGTILSPVVAKDNNFTKGVDALIEQNRAAFNNKDETDYKAAKVALYNAWKNPVAGAPYTPLQYGTALDVLSRGEEIWHARNTKKPHEVKPFKDHDDYVSHAQRVYEPQVARLVGGDAAVASGASAAPAASPSAPGTTPAATDKPEPAPKVEKHVKVEKNPGRLTADGYKVGDDTLYTIARASDALKAVKDALGSDANDHEAALALALIIARKNDIENVDFVKKGSVLKMPSADDIKNGAASIKAGIFSDGTLDWKNDMHANGKAIAVHTLVSLTPLATPAPGTDDAAGGVTKDGDKGAKTKDPVAVPTTVSGGAHVDDHAGAPLVGGPIRSLDQTVGPTTSV